MKAIVVEQFGPPADLVHRDWPEPKARAGEVLVDVHAVGLNFPDVLVAAGTYQILPPLPFVPGKELAGIVAAVGPGVSGFAVGDRVMAQCENGAFAERVAVAVDRCFAVPEGLSLMKAAAMGLTYQTSWFGLFDRGQLKAGETVLVTGAGGGIGVATMQIAKAAGCHILAGIGSRDKHDFVLEQGADAVIDMSAGNLKESVREQAHAATGGRGVDVVIENVGGEVFEACLRALAWSGRLVVVGFTGGGPGQVKANYLLIKHITVSGLHWSDYLERCPDKVRDVQSRLFADAVAGRLDPPICAVLPLAGVASAMDLIVSRRARGKVVLLTGRGRADPLGAAAMTVA
ncbi:MAG: NADPH2:quinone reductase [Xanthobacteraceae bacterium]|nr:MAG: NADPH2:quinone reductase [Xanthobacteraceae bacterium]